jgi:hypothetical protein
VTIWRRDGASNQLRFRACGPKNLNYGLGLRSDIENSLTLCSTIFVTNLEGNGGHDACLTLAMNGRELLEQIIEATGLPQDLARRELEALIKSRNLSLENLSIDRLREILAVYLQDTLLSQIKN